jgi:hypothetical protein
VKLLQVSGLPSWILLAVSLTSLPNFVEKEELCSPGKVKASHAPLASCHTLDCSLGACGPTISCPQWQLGQQRRLFSVGCCLP